MPLDRAMRRAKVMDYDLQRQIAPLMAELKPLPSIYYPTFINAKFVLPPLSILDRELISRFAPRSQSERADNVLPGDDKSVHLEKIRSDIRAFKAANSLDTVIVLWTANTERYSEIIPGINDTKENLLQAVKDSHPEVSPSTIFAIASILEGSPFINGAPQNTFVPGCIELAEYHKAFIAGDDFKSGQTKVKSVLAEFLVSCPFLRVVALLCLCSSFTQVNAGIKPLSIACTCHVADLFVERCR